MHLTTPSPIKSYYLTNFFVCGYINMMKVNGNACSTGSLITEQLRQLTRGSWSDYIYVHVTNLRLIHLHP